MEPNQKISIKVSVAGRVYPLSVLSKEEEKIKQAAKTLNDRIKSYEENFSVKDSQDLLAMCALEFAVKSQENHSKDMVSISTDQIIDSLAEMENFLTQYLSKN
jgi:cell division protein ZapA